MNYRDIRDMARESRREERGTYIRQTELQAEVVHHLAAAASARAGDVKHKTPARILFVAISALLPPISAGVISVRRDSANNTGRYDRF